MKNVQVTVDKETLEAVDRVRRPLGLKRSEIVRQALRDWLRLREVESFEQGWIAALRRNPDVASRADDWREVQEWTEE
jgi:metal-responsive CopG/Arc/MetJ family transcriptional regulator